MFRKPPLPFAHPVCLLATWFGAGLMPKAPGTWGSFAALPFAWLIAYYGGVWSLIAATVLVSLVGWWAAAAYAKALGREDPGDVVIDEVAGQWLSLISAGTDIGLFAVGFIAFRFADILKPWPAGWANARLHGGLGIMLDDILAGIYAGLAVYALRFALGDA